MDEYDYVFCEDVTGVLGQMLAGDTSELPEEALRYLQKAYEVCANALESEN